MASVIDKQIATIIHCLDLDPDWKKKIAAMAVEKYGSEFGGAGR
jgi:hypothetical protein